ncbi:MAG: ArsI/CadI family heavy metal resistance metalloenzyme [Acidobacteriota bacterium]
MALKTHLALNTPDFAKSLAFYRAFFGQEPVKQREGYAKFDLAEPGLNLTLNAVDQPLAQDGPGGINHLGIQVSSTAEVKAAAERLSSAGLATWEENDTDCCYALQDKVWVRDPDGNGWEIFVVKVADIGAGLEDSAACVATAAGPASSQEMACCTSC